MFTIRQKVFSELRCSFVVQVTFFHLLLLFVPQCVFSVVLMKRFLGYSAAKACLAGGWLKAVLRSVRSNIKYRGKT